MTKQLSGWAATMFALSSLAGCETEEAASGGGGQGGEASTTGSTVATTSGATNSATSAQTTSGVGGSSFDCDPPADPGSLYELFAESQDPLTLEAVNMCQYRRDVLLIVNTAAL